MKKTILTKSYKAVAISFFIIFLGIVTLFVALRVTDYKIGFDLQNKACIGRVFIYKNIVANDYISNHYELEHTMNVDFDYNNITSMFRFLGLEDPLEKGMATHSSISAWRILQYSFLVNSMDRGAWWATVYGFAKSRTQLSNFYTFSYIAGIFFTI